MILQLWMDNMVNLNMTVEEQQYVSPFHVCDVIKPCEHLLYCLYTCYGLGEGYV